MSYTCPISLEPIQFVAELTTCGHIFEAFMLYEHAQHSNLCPVCREIFRFSNIYHSRTLQNIISRDYNAKDISTQCDTDHAESHTIDNSTQTEITIEPQTITLSFNDVYRVIDLNRGYVNPESNNIKHLTNVNINNQRFKFDDITRVPINRYVYQSNIVDVEELAGILSVNNYFVYDLIPINNTGLRRYILYTIQHKLDGSFVTLSKYKNISNRLNP